MNCIIMKGEKIPIDGCGGGVLCCNRNKGRPP